jgi:uncharacterized protein YmfQ (DUF2313 family)
MQRADYLAQLQALLPPGSALTRATDSDLTAILDVAAGELARVEARADVLIEEADPRTTSELLSDWEAVYGLPDPCLPLNAGITERRAALVARITGVSGQSQGFFIALAASFGVAVTITEFTVARAGMLRAGQPCNGLAWAFAWRVNAPAIATIRFRAGSPAGAVLQSAGSAILECLFARLKPAHTKAFFAYGA